MWRRLHEALQLSLWPRAEAAPPLDERLRRLGLPAQFQVRTHRNRSILVSVSRGASLRVHAGYAFAPDQVLRAIVLFARPGLRPSDRRAARRELLAFPVDHHVPSRPPRRRAAEPARPGDERILSRLRALHEILNTRYFGGRLPDIPLRLSGRMKRRLGEVRLESGTRRAVEIVLSRRHVLRDGWLEAEQTLLHEMVHQWQAETGRPVNHDADFRRKAREVGIDPRAVRRD